MTDQKYKIIREYLFGDYHYSELRKGDYAEYYENFQSSWGTPDNRVVVKGMEITEQDIYQFLQEIALRTAIIGKL